MVSLGPTQTHKNIVGSFAIDIGWLFLAMALQLSELIAQVVRVSASSMCHAEYHRLESRPTRDFLLVALTLLTVWVRSLLLANRDGQNKEIKAGQLFNKKPHNYFGKQNNFLWSFKLLLNEDVRYNKLFCYESSKDVSLWCRHYLLAERPLLITNHCLS